MASIKESAAKIYTGENALGTNILFFIVSMTVAATIFFYGPKSLVTNAIIISLSFLLTGFCLKLMHEVIKDNSQKLPEIDTDILIIALKFIPAGLLCGVICSLISFVLGLIPILGALIAGLLTTMIESLMMLMYCEKFDVLDAFNFKKLKFLLGPLLRPIIILSLKMLLFVTLVVTPIAGLFAYIFTFLLKNNIFIFAAIFAYLVMVSVIVYFDNLAQIYAEITFDLQESDYN